MATTVSLKVWVPKLAKAIHGRNYSPNYDMITHLEAQQIARKLGIKWGMEMNASDVATVSAALTAQYSRKG